MRAAVRTGPPPQSGGGASAFHAVTGWQQQTVYCLVLLGTLAALVVGITH
ncbi:MULTISPECIES: hypothetical protein [unclassified Streptomyces]|nr:MULTISPECIES: hypothetical protein [unclassified Streptomyces]